VIEPSAVGLESIRDVLEEDQPQDDVLVFGCIHKTAQLVRRSPEFLYEAESGDISFIGKSTFGRFLHPEPTFKECP